MKLLHSPVSAGGVHADGCAGEDGQHLLQQLGGGEAVDAGLSICWDSPTGQQTQQVRPPTAETTLPGKADSVSL